MFPLNLNIVGLYFCLHRHRYFNSCIYLCRLDANWKEICIPGSGRSNVKELWVDKYKPHSLEELAVHKKKVSIFPLFHFCLSALLDVYIEGYSFSWYLQVEEVKSWFEERLKTTKVNLYLSKLLPFVLFPWRSCTFFLTFFLLFTIVKINALFPPRICRAIW